MKSLSKHQNKTWQDLEVTSQELKTTVINMLKALMDEIDSVREWMSNVSKDGNTKKTKQLLEIKSTVLQT